MRIEKDRRGFTLLELILAVSISSVVLITVFSIAASMVQFEVESGRHGSVTAWSLAAISNMDRDIADASVVEWPLAGNPGDNSLVLCTNWSRNAVAGQPNGGQLPGSPNPAVIYYCWDSTANVLRKMILNNSCPNVGTGPPACSAAGYGAGSVVATAVYQYNGNWVFANDTQPNANSNGALQEKVHLQFVVGNPAQGTVNGSGTSAIFTNPQSLTFDTRITLED